MNPTLGKSPEKPSIVVLGSMNMDLVVATSRLPRPGETIAGNDFQITPGGKGGNQAVAAARLGAAVRMVGLVGNDTFGSILTDKMILEGVDITGIQTDSISPSGTAVIILDRNNQNHIVAVYGANMRCDQRQVKDTISALDGADCLMLQLEIPMEVNIAAAAKAKHLGITVILDPAPARKIPTELYQVTDIITPNQGEAASLTGNPVTNLEEAMIAARDITLKGVPISIVKLGQQGVVYGSKESVAHVNPLDVDAINTVGAGDAFGGGLAVGLAEGMGLDDAIRFGSAVGALSTTKPGAQDAMPYRSQVEQFIQP